MIKSMSECGSEKMDLCDKSFYVSNILDEIKTEDNWSIVEIKILILLLKELSDSRIYLKKSDNINSLDSDVILDHLEEVPLNYEFDKNLIQSITNISSTNFSRDIKKTCKSMIKKVVDTPSPLDPNNPKSFKLFSWFTDAEYIEKYQVIKINLHIEMVKRLAVFRQYTSLDYGMIFSLNNAYSLKVYLSCKIMLSKYKINDSIKLEIDSFKNKIGLRGKYVKPSLFEKYVLSVIKNEINNLTDLNFDYELHKTGKRFTDITLKFSQKKDTSKQLYQSKQSPKKIEHQTTDLPLNLDINNQDIIIVAQLQSYGISRKKALEYVKNYGIDTCKVGIEKLISEIQKGKDIRNISGYLVSCIENEGNNLNSKEIKAVMGSAEELIKARKAKDIQRFNSFDAYINNNEQQILILLLRHEANEKLIDELEIDILRCLKDIVVEYRDLEYMPTYYLTVRFKDEILNYSKIKTIIEELEVASKQERIEKLKTDLEAKKLELKGAGNQSKEFFEKEITILKVAIADLV